MFCSIMVLPALGGETIRPRWPLPIGAHQIHDAAGDVFGGAVAALQLQALVREQRREVLEQHLVLGFRAVTVDVVSTLSSAK
jgi:hypothetical protein